MLKKMFSTGSLLIIVISLSLVFSSCNKKSDPASPENNVDTQNSFLAWTGSSETENANLQWKLIRINGGNGTVTPIGGQDFFTSIVYSPDGTLYGVAGDLHIINPKDGSTTKIGDFSYGTENYILMGSAAFSPNGKLFVQTVSSDSVFSVDLSTARLTYIGVTPQSPDIISGITFDKDGTLYGAFSNLYKLNPTDMSIIKKIGSTGSYIGNLAFSNNGTLFGIDIYPSTNLYSLDLSSGEAKSVTSLSSSEIVCIAVERATSNLGKFQAIKNNNGLAPHETKEKMLQLEKEYKEALKKNK